jgi:hypothetical protein
MDIAAYLQQYLVTNDDKVIGNIPNFLSIAVSRVNKRLKSAFLEMVANPVWPAQGVLPADLVAIKWLTVNGTLYFPSLVAKDGTYNVAAGAVTFSPALVDTDSVEYVYYAVNQDILTAGSPAVLLHAAAAEALMFEGNQEGAAAELALFERDLDECLGWEAHGPLSLGGLGGSGAAAVATTGGGSGGGGGSITASQVGFIPSGDLVSTNVQAALVELDTEKAPLASPVFSGVPQVPTAAPLTNTNQAASCAFVLANGGGGGGGMSPSDSNPLMDGVAAPGSSGLASRGDHVHPADTSRAKTDGTNASGTWPVNISGTAALATNATTAATANAVNPANQYSMTGLTVTDPITGNLAGSATKWGGSVKHVSTSAPTAGDGVDGDIWFQRDA